MHIKLPIQSILFLCISFSLSNISSAQISADFSSDVQFGCAPLTVEFTSDTSSHITVWAWDFGDGSPVNNNQNPIHTYLLPGTYTVSLHVEDSMNTDDEIKSNFITVFDPPTALFSLSEREICTGDSVSFVDISISGSASLSGQNWNFGDGSAIGSGSFISHVFTNMDSIIAFYIISLSVSDVNGCYSSYSDTVEVSPIPSVSIAVDSISQGPPYTVYFLNTSIGFPFYSWDFGDPASAGDNYSILEHPTHEYALQGVYQVSMAIGIAGCEAQGSLSVDLISLNTNESSFGNDVKVHPNPAIGILHVEVSNYIDELVKVSIYDLLGNQVISREGINRNGSFSIDISGISPGIYIVELCNRKNSFKTKIAKH